MALADTSKLDPTLREHVRLLGNILGDAIAADHGQDFIGIVEEIRQKAKAARRQEGGWEALSDYLGALPEGELIYVTRAFNQFLNLANIAEQRYRIRTYEKEKNAQGLKAVLEQLNRNDPARLQTALDDICIELMLTAHPAEVVKRTLIKKYIDIGTCLRCLEEHPADRDAEERLIRLIWECWHTGEVRQGRPTPDTEAKWGFAIIEHSLWHAVPAFFRTLHQSCRALKIKLPSWQDNSVSFTSWMGGDFDGNRDLTPDMMHEILMLSRWMAADLFIRDVEELQQDLSMTLCTSELELAVGEQQEPYRALMRKLRDQLVKTRIWSENLQPAPPPEDILWDDEMLKAPLELCYRSLTASGLRVVAEGKLQDTLYRAGVFGVHLLKLDIRQHADKHTAVLDELTAHLGILNDQNLSYADWQEPERLEFLLRELTGNRPLFPKAWPASKDVQETLKLHRLIAWHGCHAISKYLISMTSQPSDVLAVILLLKEAGLEQSLAIVPLFETAQSLDNAADYFDTLLSIDWYRDYCKGSQQVMVGYSNAAKDQGQLASAWGRHQAKIMLSKAAKALAVDLTFCHGRGSAVGRDINQTRNGILSQPPDSITGHLAVLEQGEMIDAKFGQPPLAEHSLTLYFSSVLEASMQPPPHPKLEWLSQMTSLADAAAAGYDEIVRHMPDFVAYFKTVTPEEELNQLAFGIGKAQSRGAKTIDELPTVSWVLAWTQTRLMLPGWLGTDKAFANADNQDQLSLLQEMFEKWPFFRIQIDILSTVLAKMDLSLVSYYHNRLAQGRFQALDADLQKRARNLLAIMNKLRKSITLLTDDPGFQESLRVRHTYLDPLHLLQAELLDRLRVRELSKKEHDTTPQALKVTIAGISSGLGVAG